MISNKPNKPTFYTNLYTQPKTDGGVMEAFLNSIKLPEVRDEQNKSLIGEITEGEIKKAISHFKTNKASGPNRFPSEWR